MSQVPDHKPHLATLERRLGPLDAAAIVVSNVIGSGIFFLPIIVAGMVPTSIGMLSVWLLGGLLAFAGAMAYAELGVAPSACWRRIRLSPRCVRTADRVLDRLDVVRRRVFWRDSGERQGVGAYYLGGFLPATAHNGAILTIPMPLAPLVVTPQSLLAIAVIAVLSLIHISGLGPGRLVHNVLATVESAGAGRLHRVAVFDRDGIVRDHLSASHTVPITGHRLAARDDSGDVQLLRVGTRPPTSRRRFAILAGTCRSRWASGTGAVVVIYLGLNALYLYALGPADLAGLIGKNVGLTDAVAQRLFGQVAGARPRRVHDRQHCREHQRDGARRASCLLRDGTRRRLPASRGARAQPLQDARHCDHRASRLEFDPRVLWVPRRSGAVHRLRA